MRPITRLILGLGLVLVAPVVLAQGNAVTPAGTWHQVDDHTGKVTSVIRITDRAGTLVGTVLKVLNMAPETIARDGNPPICTQCQGTRHNQPVEGMTVLWGVTRDGNQWDSGHILDPHNGKVYKVKLTLDDGGRKLKVRGYIGFSLIGRTQVWQRVTPGAP